MAQPTPACPGKLSGGLNIRYEKVLLSLLAFFVIVWGIGDVAITYVGSHGILYNEINPIALASYGVAGWYALIAIKAVVCTALCAACLFVYQKSERLGMAMGMTGAVFSILLFGFNLVMVFGA